MSLGRPLNVAAGADYSSATPRTVTATGLREAAERFLAWYDSPGRSYRRDGEGSASIAALRAALSTPAPGLDAVHPTCVRDGCVVIAAEAARQAARLAETDQP